LAVRRQLCRSCLPLLLLRCRSRSLPLLLLGRRRQDLLGLDAEVCLLLTRQLDLLPRLAMRAAVPAARWQRRSRNN